MKLKLFSYILSLFLVTPLMARTQPMWNVLTTIQLHIPNGQSVYSIPLKPARTVTPFIITYTPTASCGQFSITPRVRYQGSTTLSNVRMENGAFATDQRKIDLIEIRFQQTAYQALNCQLSVQYMNPSATSNPAPPSDPGPAANPGTPSAPVNGEGAERVYAGLVDHSGGFVNRKPVTLQAAYYTQDIELTIPDYCSSYEVTDLGVVTSTDTILLKPRSERERSFNFHLPKAMTISHLEVSLLAPQDETCQIPVYIRPRPRSL